MRKMNMKMVKRKKKMMMNKIIKTVKIKIIIKFLFKNLKSHFYKEEKKVVVVFVVVIVVHSGVYRGRYM